MISLKPRNEDEFTSIEAKEIAEIGILPCQEQKPIGFVFNIAGQLFVVYGYADKEEFKKKIDEGIQNLSFPTSVYHSINTPFYLKVSTD